MRLLNFTADDPEANLALDDALHAAAERGELPGGVLRLWESPRPAVVLGRSSRVEDEVRWDVCQREGVPVLRRSSGGATVVAGPGCLMYAVVLEASYAQRLPAIDAAHELVLGRIAAALAAHVPGVARSGTSDLTVPVGGEQKKFSGNSLRVRRRSILYHGTILYDFDLSCLSRWLAEPPRQPEYRERRAHDEFVTNVALSRKRLERVLVDAWDAREPLDDWRRFLA